jgi:predicted NBD/HSP70 family sugar kinase
MGLLLEVGQGESTGGRRAAQLTFRQETGLVLAVELGSTHARWRLADFAGRSLAEEELPIVISSGADQILPLIDQGVREELRERGVPPEVLRACAVGFPGPLNFPHGAVVGPPNMTGWDEAPIPELLAKWLPVPTVVDNDVNVMALGDYEAHWRHEGIHDLIFIKHGTGIGCGIIAGGHLYRGADGTAGEIGHIQVEGVDSPDLCTCGGRNCLEVVASGRALVRRLRAEGYSVGAAADVSRLVMQGDVVAMNMVREAGRALGSVMSGIVNFSNPAAIVMGGSIGSVGAPLLAGMREAIYGQATVFSTRHLRIVPNHLERGAGLHGATLMALDLAYGSSISRALGGPESSPATSGSDAEGVTA